MSRSSQLEVTAGKDLAAASYKLAGQRTKKSAAGRGSERGKVTIDFRR